VGDDEPKAPGGAANRTIQIDALTDVQLVDDHPDEPVVSRAPPPLPPKQAPGPSRARAFALTGLALVLGVVAALGVVHFLLPAPPAATAPAPTAPSTGAVRRVQMDDEFVIRAADPGDD
jgi:hypothetical protein